MKYPTPTDTSAHTIDVSKARTVAERLRAIEASGRRLTGGQRWVLECCERRVKRAEPQEPERVRIGAGPKRLEVAG